MTQPIDLQRLAGGPAASFEEPFDMLHACHERVQRMLTLLARLRQHLPAHGCDTQAQQAARDVMRYFDQAAPQHHLDEELHVLPRLRASGDAAQAALAERLRQDHADMAARWPPARAVLEAIAHGRLPRLSAADAATIDAFAGLYHDHIAAEEQQAYPAAATRLDRDALRVMGEEMMRRRGL